jgi:hypothetical protein
MDPLAKPKNTAKMGVFFSFRSSRIKLQERRRTRRTRQEKHHGLAFSDDRDKAGANTPPAIGREDNFTLESRVLNL